MEANFMVSAEGVLGGWRVHTLLTAVFSHFDAWHGLFNMLFLYWFGREIESIYGKKDYLTFLLLSGLVASLAYVVIQGAFSDGTTPALGASGAVMAVVVVYAFFFPNRRILFLGLFPMTVKWLAILYVATDLLGALNPSGSQVAHTAHLGGALTGFLWYKLGIRVFPAEGDGHGIGARIEAWIRKLRARGTRPQRKPSAQEDERRVDSATEERVDRLLEKIAREGIGSLSDDERKFLTKASSRYRG
jgi:membrane associated rhomboid family serine protease